MLLIEETKKYERMLRDRNASASNLTEAESGARRQGVELSARDGTIVKLKEQLDKVTNDFLKKSTKIEDLRGNSSKKAAKIEGLRNQRTGLRNRLVELDNLRALLNISTDDISALEENLSQRRDEKNSLQLFCNEVGLALETIEHGEHAGTPSTIGVRWRIR